MTKAPQTKARLTRLVNVIAQSGNPDEPFYYLGGPMTDIPKFNFPRFTYVAKRLREAGFNIVTPHELDDKETEKAALASPDGAPGSGAVNGERWQDFLARDLIVVSLPTCKGGIFMEGWHRSNGAKLESYTLDRLKKEVMEYDDGVGMLDEFVLTTIDRDTRLEELENIDSITRSFHHHRSLA